MALTNKQIKKKLRQLARQDAPIRCGDLREAGPYQFSSPQPPQPQRKWVSRIAVCAACVAVAVSAVLLASPFLSSMGPQSTGPVSSTHGTSYFPESSNSAATTGEQIPIKAASAGIDWKMYKQENGEQLPFIKRFRSAEEFREHLSHYPDFQPGDSHVSDYVSSMMSILYGTLDWHLQEDLYEKHDLIWIRAESSAFHNYECTVESVERKGSKVIIHLLEMMRPETEPDDNRMTWEFFVLLQRDLLNEDDTISVQFNTASPRKQRLITLEEWNAVEATGNKPREYYGTYGDCMAFRFTDEREDSPDFEWVAGKCFDYRMPGGNLNTFTKYPPVEILRGTDRCSLTDAYNRGWITYADVQDIYLYSHTNWLSCFDTESSQSSGG